jgi:hemolysin III
MRAAGSSVSTPQSPAEELANSLTHGLGVLLAIAALVLMVVKAHGARAVVGVTIFGSTLILLYLMSTLYHAFRGPRVKLVFKVFDHSAIFLLIAGTYTPLCLSTLGGAAGWTLFGLVWGLAVLGVTFKALFYARLAKQVLRPAAVDHLHGVDVDDVMDPVFAKRMGLISTLIYLLMGWLVVIFARPFYHAISHQGLLWILAGGLCYSFGAIIYGLKKVPFHHAIWHLFVLGGSACHVFAVMLHGLPR